MDKETFKSEISPSLKHMGYRKHGNYWYKQCNDLVFCINVQGSQWDKNDYYVEIGFAACTDGVPNPKILQWICRRRCGSRSGGKNIFPEDLINYIEEMHNSISAQDQVPAFLKQARAQKIANQFWIL